MSFLSNAHTHSTYCDGKSSVAEMVQRAKALGFVSLGFSGHAMQGFDFAYSMSKENQCAYLKELRARQEEQSQPRLWAGLELDILANEEARRVAFSDFDYVIGSTHYLTPAWHGESVAVDGDLALLKRYVDEVFSGDGLAMVRAYYEIEAQGLLRGRPAIIGHFDLVRKPAKPLKLFDETSPAYRRLALEALERVFPCGAVLEINTGGMARGYLDTPSPTLELLCAWRELGGRITITSDCHDARYLDFAFDSALALARAAGFQSVLRLGTGDVLWEEVEV